MTEPADAAETAGTQVVANIGELLRSAQSLQQAAREGAFAVDPQHGKELVEFLRHWRDEFGKEKRTIGLLGQRLPLGSSPGANVYAPFFQRSATDEEQGVVIQLERFVRALEETEQAIIESMKHYEYSDQGAADQGRRITAELGE